MNSLIQNQTTKANNPDSDLAALDLDTDYAGFQRNEAIETWPPDLENGLSSGYSWFSSETNQVAASTDFLGMLQELENQYGLPSGTAERLNSHHEDASSVSEEEEMRYATAWDAYQLAIESDDDMATLARAYGTHTRMPLCQRINAEGLFIF